MPLYADIRVNDLHITTINIGRLHGGTKPDDLNTYAAIQTEKGGTPDWYDEDAVKFVHRYGDGAEVCVALALKALGYTGSRTGITPPRNKSKDWDGNGWDYKS